MFLRRVNENRSLNLECADDHVVVLLQCGKLFLFYINIDSMDETEYTILNFQWFFIWCSDAKIEKYDYVCFNEFTYFSRFKTGIKLIYVFSCLADKYINWNINKASHRVFPWKREFSVKISGNSGKIGSLKKNSKMVVRSTKNLTNSILYFPNWDFEPTFGRAVIFVVRIGKCETTTYR